MREALLEYYERELTYMRQLGGEFARRYPRVAGKLLLDAETCSDPHVERLLETFAFMAARVHLRLDDDFPQLTESLLNLIYPTYLRPIPAMTIVEFESDPSQGKKNAGAVVPRETPLVSRHTVNRMPVRFKTAYDVELWPLRVSQAEWRQPGSLKRPARPTGEATAAAAARIRLSCLPDVSFAGLGLQRLRFFLSGDPGMVYPLYELLASRCVEIQLTDPQNSSRIVSMDPSHIRMVGFEPNEALLPLHRRSVDGHRLLQEYFTFAEKFLFFEIDGLELVTGGSFGRELDVVLLFSRFERPDRQQVLELGVNEQTFRLGCTPAINLFRRGAEPILLSQTRPSYPVIPDARQGDAIEVYSVDAVVATNPQMRQSVALEPLLTFRHQSKAESAGVYWTASRKLSEFGDRRPSTVELSVVDVDGNLQQPEADVLAVNCTCTNFDLPSRVNFGAPEGDFEAVGVGAAKIVTALRRPTPSVDPPHGPAELWRLISQLSLNYLSLTESGRGALQEILRLHNFTGSDFLEQQIGAITRLRSEPHFAMVESDYGLSPARGTAVTVDLDEQQFAGSSAYLFGAVLDRFLGGYASINSFAQLTVFSNQRKEAMNTWPARAGSQVLL